MITFLSTFGILLICLPIGRQIYKLIGRKYVTSFFSVGIATFLLFIFCQMLFVFGVFETGNPVLTAVSEGAFTGKVLGASIPALALRWFWDVLHKKKTDTTADEV